MCILAVYCDCSDCVFYVYWECRNYVYEYLNSTTAQFRRLSFFVGDKKLFLTEIQCSSNIRFSVVVNDNSVHNVTIFYVCRRHSSGPGEG